MSKSKTELSKMLVKELRQLAEDKGIDIPKGAKKSEIVKLLEKKSAKKKPTSKKKPVKKESPKKKPKEIVLIEKEVKKPKNYDELKKLSFVDLRKLCKKHKLPDGCFGAGKTKEYLILKLSSHFGFEPSEVKKVSPKKVSKKKVSPKVPKKKVSPKKKSSDKLDKLLEECKKRRVLTECKKRGTIEKIEKYLESLDKKTKKKSYSSMKVDELRKECEQRRSKKECDKTKLKLKKDIISFLEKLDRDESGKKKIEEKHRPKIETETETETETEIETETESEGEGKKIKVIKSRKKLSKVKLEKPQKVEDKDLCFDSEGKNKCGEDKICVVRTGKCKTRTKSGGIHGGLESLRKSFKLGPDEELIIDQDLRLVGTKKDLEKYRKTVKSEKKTRKVEDCTSVDSEDCGEGFLCSAKTRRCEEDNEELRNKNKYKLDVNGKLVIGTKKDLEKLKESLDLTSKITKLDESAIITKIIESGEKISEIPTVTTTKKTEKPKSEKIVRHHISPKVEVEQQEQLRKTLQKCLSEIAETP